MGVIYTEEIVKRKEAEHSPGAQWERVKREELGAESLGTPLHKVRKSRAGY
jgi:hypothetical protein